MTLSPVWWPWPVSTSTACKDAAIPAIPERLSAQNIWGAEVLVNWGVLRGSPHLSILFSVLEHGSRLLVMSSVGVARTSCVHCTGGLLLSVRGWAANLMLIERGDVKGKFILTCTKTLMKTSGKISAGGFCDRKEIRLSSPCSLGIREQSKGPMDRKSLRASLCHGGPLSELTPAKLSLWSL